MQRFITLAFSALLLLSLNAATPETHYTVIVSLDGFRWDYPDMYKTPNLDRMAADGVKAVMLPSGSSKYSMMSLGRSGSGFCNQVSTVSIRCSKVRKGLAFQGL